MENVFAVLENNITRISATVCQNGTDHDLIILGVSQIENRIQEDVNKSEERFTALEEAIIRNSATVCQYGKELESIKAAACHGTHGDADAISFAEGADGLDDPSAEDVPTATAPEKDDAVFFAEGADEGGLLLLLLPKTLC